MAEPDWMGGPSQEPAPGAAPASGGGGGADKKAAYARVFFKCLNLVVIPVFMGWTAISDFMTLKWQSGTFFVATYVLFFGALLFLFELQLLRPCAPVERVLRSNFGFLYRPFSKALFFIFLAFLEFGLDAGDSNIYGILCGALLIADGVMYGMCALSRPHYIAAPGKGSTYTPPEPAASSSSDQPAWSNV